MVEQEVGQPNNYEQALKYLKDYDYDKDSMDQRTKNEFFQAILLDDQCTPDALSILCEDGADVNDLGSLNMNFLMRFAL